MRSSRACTRSGALAKWFHTRQVEGIGTNTGEPGTKRDIMRPIEFVSAFVVLTLMAAPALGEEGSAKTSLNVRSGPGLQQPVIGGLAPGEPVTIDQCANSWCLIQGLNTRGWVAEAYLQRSKFSQSWSAVSQDLPATLPGDASKVTIGVQLNLNAGGTR